MRVVDGDLEDHVPDLRWQAKQRRVGVGVCATQTVSVQLLYSHLHVLHMLQALQIPESDKSFSS